MKKRILLGHLAAAGAYLIFGVNVVVCRDIASADALPPIVLFALRAGGATVLFWLLAIARPRETVPPKDLLRIAGASLLGIFLPQITFLHGIALTTPVDLTIVNTTTPILTMFVAAIFLKEPITWKKVLGVVVSFGGILWLILQSVLLGGGSNQTQPLGLVYCFANSTVFALYLGICRPVISRYSVVTTMKWMFLLSFLLSIPFVVPHLPETQWTALCARQWWEVAFVILFSTFVAYFLIPYGQQRIRPTLVSMYGYLQPIVAISIAITTGMDRLTVTKVLAALLVFVGVYIVNQSRAATPMADNRKQSIVTNPSTDSSRKSQ